MTSLLEVLQRCETLLDATMRFMEKNPVAAEYCVYYDEAVCDGECLANDCSTHLDEVRRAIAMVGDNS